MYDSWLALKGQHRVHVQNMIKQMQHIAANTIRHSQLVLVVRAKYECAVRTVDTVQAAPEFVSLSVPINRMVRPLGFGND